MGVKNRLHMYVPYVNTKYGGVTVKGVRRYLKMMGLDVCTAAERQVLDYIAKATFCKDPDDEWVFDDCMLETPVAEAELHRRMVDGED